MDINTRQNIVYASIAAILFVLLTLNILHVRKLIREGHRATRILISGGPSIAILTLVISGLIGLIIANYGIVLLLLGLVLLAYSVLSIKYPEDAIDAADSLGAIFSIGYQTKFSVYVYIVSSIFSALACIVFGLILLIS